MAEDGQEELAEVMITGEEMQAFTLHCEPVLETISEQETPGAEEGDDW